MSYYSITIRRVSNGSFTDALDIGSVRYLKIPDGARIPTPAHAIARTDWVKDILALFSAESAKPSGDVAFFVHGYNNTLDNIWKHQKQLHAGINRDGFKCPVIAFDWPSDAATIAYLDDLDHAVKTSLLLVNSAIKLFVATLRQDCDIRVHVVGHSMGAFLIREAFDHADGGSTAGANWTAGQLALFAGDASATKFSKTNTETESLYRHCYRLTNYFSGYDEVLQISNVKRLGFAPRVGRIGLPPDAPAKAANVDCSRHYAERYGIAGQPLSKTHSWYFEDDDFLHDLRLTLRGAIDRFKIPTRANGPLGEQELLTGVRSGGA